MGHGDVVQRLLEGRADVNAKNKFGTTGLIRAAQNGHVDVVQRLLEGRADVDAKNKKGETGLIRAAENGHADVVQRLLEGRSDVNAKTNDDYGWTGLIRAAQNGHADVVQRLLEGSADVDAKNNWGQTGIITAASDGHVDVVQRLLEGRADVNAQDKFGWTGLILAASHGDVDMVQRLLENRADVDAKGKYGWTGLMEAAENGHADVVQRLLEGRADLDVKDKPGHTAVVLAALNIHAETVQRLLEGKADPRDNDFHIEAIRKGNVSAKDLLEHCFRDASEDIYDGQKRLKPLGPARRSSEGPRPWDAVWEIKNDIPSTSMKGEMVSDGIIEDCELITAADTLLKHVADGVPICHFITTKKGLLTQELVAALAEADARPEIFAMKETHAILNAIWESRCRWLYLLEYGSDITLACLAISSGVNVRHDGKTTATKIISMAMLLSKSILNELAQLWSATLGKGDGSSSRESDNNPDADFLIDRFLRKMCSIARHIYVNVSDYVCLGIAIYGWTIVAFEQDLHGDGHELELGVLAVWVFNLMMSSVMGVRAFTPFGPRMLPIMNSIIDVKEFALISVAVLAAFTMAYYILCTRDAPADDGFLVSSPLYAAFVHMFRLGVLGDFDLFELEGVDPTYTTEGDGTLSPVDPPPTRKYLMVHLVFFGTALVCTVMLMNLLVGILGGSYDRFEDQSIELFLHQRAKIIAGMGRIPWYRRLIWPSHWKDEAFWFTVRRDPGDEDMRSVRAVIKQELTKIDKKMADTQSGMHARMEKMEAHLKEIRDLLRTKEART